MHNHHYKLFKKPESCNYYKEAFMILYEHDIDSSPVRYTLISYSKIAADVTIKDCGTKKEYTLFFYNMDSPVHLRAFLKALWYMFHLNFLEDSNTEKTITKKYLQQIKDKRLKVTKEL